MKSEIKMISEKLVAAGLDSELNFTQEVTLYQEYRNNITDEGDYVKTLVAVIQPVHSLALYSYCIELCLSDGLLQASEEKLLQHLAAALSLNEEERSVCKKTMLQRYTAEKEKVI